MRLFSYLAHLKVNGTGIIEYERVGEIMREETFVRGGNTDKGIPQSLKIRMHDKDKEVQTVDLNNIVSEGNDDYDEEVEIILHQKGVVHAERISQLKSRLSCHNIVNKYNHHIGDN